MKTGAITETTDYGMLGMRSTSATLACLFLSWLPAGDSAQRAPVPPSSRPRTYRIPTVDLADETQMQVVVDHEPYVLGHADTVLLLWRPCNTQTWTSG